jgi:hypothetical protein
MDEASAKALVLQETREQDLKDQEEAGGLQR